MSEILGERGSRKQQSELGHGEIPVPGADEAEMADGAVGKAEEQQAERPSLPVCGDCRAWLPTRAANPERGRCHRRAPVVVHAPETADMEAGELTVWPETAPDEGCWDHLPLEVPR